MRASALIVRILAGSGALTGLFVAVIGFAHTPSGKPLLRYIPGMGADCPVGADAAMALTPEQRDAARRAALDFDRGSTPAAARPALGFTLDQTTAADVRAWAAQHGVSCAESAEELRCTGVPAAALGGTAPADDLLLRFDSAGALVTVQAHVPAAGPGEAASLVTAISREVEAAAGPPAISQGEASEAFLARTALRQASTAFRFSDYRADVSATNMGDGRMVVRVSFQSSV